jgi:hypothetical protein
MHYLYRPSVLLIPECFVVIILLLTSHLHMHYLHPSSILLIPERFVVIILLYVDYF